jgi:hypothetical protein
MPNGHIELDEALFSASRAAWYATLSRSVARSEWRGCRRDDDPVWDAPPGSARRAAQRHSSAPSSRRRRTEARTPTNTESPEAEVAQQLEVRQR